MTTAKTKQCQLRGEGCQGEFELNSGQGGSNRKNCDNCQKLAEKNRRTAYEARERKKRAALPEDSKGFKKRVCIGWQFGLEERFPAEMSIRKGGRKALPPLLCLGQFKPTNGRERLCTNCKVTRRRARQGAAATAAYHTEKEQFDATGDCPEFEKRLQRGRKSANAQHKRQKDLIARAKVILAQKEPRPPHRTATKEELFKKGAELYRDLKSWGQVARKLVPGEFSKDPKGAADRLRLGAEYHKQI
jgi:hypothetical protein